MNAQDSGRKGERMAQKYLEKRGMKCLARNYRAGRHEIDLILRDGETTVFAEVKARSRSDYGTPGEAVGRAKQRFLIAAAQTYLLENGLFDRPARFDVVEIYLSTGEIVYIPNAFGL